MASYHWEYSPNIFRSKPIKVRKSLILLRSDGSGSVHGKDWGWDPLPTSSGVSSKFGRGLQTPQAEPVGPAGLVGFRPAWFKTNTKTWASTFSLTVQHMDFRVKHGDMTDSFTTNGFFIMDQQPELRGVNVGNLTGHGYFRKKNDRHASHA